MGGIRARSVSPPAGKVTRLQGKSGTLRGGPGVFPVPRIPGGLIRAPDPCGARALLSRLILIFVAVPLLELAILLRIGQWIGLMPTVAMVVATGVGGAALARHQGIRAFLAVQRELASGRLPGRSLLDGLAILVGGALLLTPGVLTDLVGFSLLIPVSRRWLQRLARRSLERRVREGSVEFQVYDPDGAATTRRAEVHTRARRSGQPR